MKDKHATIKRAVNYVKASAVNTKLFTNLCKDLNFNYETMLFHTPVGWLEKFNMLAWMYII